jgi:hypothetical protein
VLLPENRDPLAESHTPLGEFYFAFAPVRTIESFAPINKNYGVFVSVAESRFRVMVLRRRAHSVHLSNTQLAHDHRLDRGCVILRV